MPNVDDALLEAVDHQCALSEQARRPRDSLAILRHALRLVEEGGGSESQSAIITQLAKATLRLRWSAVCAAANKHHEAFVAAQHALGHADDAWRELLRLAGGAEALEPGEEEEEHSAYSALRGLLAHPPPRLGRAAELAVLARQALASQLELFAAGLELNNENAEVTGEAVFAAETLGGSGDEPLFVPPLAPTAWAEDLRREAAMLTRHFLPGRPAERFLGPEACGVLRTSASVSDDSDAWHARSRPSFRALDAGPPQLPRASSLRMRSTAPPGDVFAYSLPERCVKPKRRGKRAVAKAASVPTLSSVSSLSEPPPYVDPFTDWKQTIVDRDKMSLTQLKVQTFEGQREVKEELKYQNSMFKHVELKALDALGEFRLVENRTLFSGYGMRTTEMTKRREEAWQRERRPPSKKELEQLEEEQKLFEHYGVSFSKGRTSPSMKDLRKLFHECNERSPMVKEQRRREAEERRADEQRRRQETELEDLRVQKEKLSAMQTERLALPSTLPL